MEYILIPKKMTSIFTNCQRYHELAGCYQLFRDAHLQGSNITDQRLIESFTVILYLQFSLPKARRFRGDASCTAGDLRFLLLELKRRNNSLELVIARAVRVSLFALGLEVSLMYLIPQPGGRFSLFASSQLTVSTNSFRGISSLVSDTESSSLSLLLVIRVEDFLAWMISRVCLGIFALMLSRHSVIFGGTFRGTTTFRSGSYTVWYRKVSFALWKSSA